MNLSIIIVNFNTKHFLGKCLKSLDLSKDNLTKEIIIVDNGSSDGTADFIKVEHPSKILVQLSKNIGFAAGNNAGAKTAGGKYLLFLNPDTEVEPDALEKMFNKMDSSKNIGALGPKLLYPDGTLQLSCRKFYTLKSIAVRRTLLNRIFNSNRLNVEHLMSDWDHNTSRKVDWVLAACMMIPKSLLERVGCFDEKYRLYFEDVDLCYRINQMGIDVCYYPDAIVHHHHQRDSAKKFSRKTMWHILSAIRFFSKYGWRL
jgi:N-acetylglucosaminyl-diphospho-decaprenol L-rhamnosyltransferase